MKRRDLLTRINRLLDNLDLEEAGLVKGLLFGFITVADAVPEMERLISEDAAVADAVLYADVWKRAFKKLEKQTGTIEALDTR